MYLISGKILVSSQKWPISVTLGNIYRSSRLWGEIREENTVERAIEHLHSCKWGKNPGQVWTHGGHSHCIKNCCWLCRLQKLSTLPDHDYVNRKVYIIICNYKETTCSLAMKHEGKSRDEFQGYGYSKIWGYMRKVLNNKFPLKLQNLSFSQQFSLYSLEINGIFVDLCWLKFPMW